MSASGRSETADDLLAALLDGMDAALCAFDSGGVITHWNREAERILGWSAAEAVGRHGFAGWAVRPADAHDVQDRLMSAQDAPGRQVHEFALLTKDGGRVLVRTQSAGVPGADGKPAGVYCAFSEVHAQIDLERSIALSEALMDDASWGVVLVDVDLRPAVVNAHAARAFGSGRTALLGRPLGELLAQGVEELEGALQHVLAEGAPPAPVELWVSVRTPEGVRRRCWRCGFLRLGSPLAEEPVPLGVGLLFQDVTEARRAELDTGQLRFRANQLHRAGRAAAECEDAAEAAAVRLDFALAGFAEHALVDVLERPGGPDSERPRLVRSAVSPSGMTLLLPGPGAIPVRYEAGHPALQALDRIGPVRSSSPRGGADEAWARARQWPEGAAHALSTVLRSRGRTLGALTFLRGPSRPAFERADALYAEEVAARVAADLDLAAHRPA
ncbi:MULTISPECIES: PAS domain-containing protein [unclassified Streptomyces]|uniref:PAS domain-containing protein n=1 Tax=unclassified Streptomyces TaxID=2593676 RepID=UPI0022544BDD|nr:MULTISPECIES: PAS domain-containing protein [unclassified Streptomyces]MCX4526479.1 PAS domain-containing protein [Streptomyces sp. NBC_01551]MCX4542958.1 PAS domain-containing protein [Streptomyces sp. NBC_01565]